MAIQGYKGSVTAGGVDVTTFADAGWSSSCQANKTWSGSITATFTGGVDTGEAAIVAGLMDGTAVDLELITDAPTAGTAGRYSGSAIITGMPITNEVSGCIIVTFPFQGNGVLTVEANPV